MADLNNTLVRGNLRVTSDADVSGNVNASTFNGLPLSGSVGANTIPIRDSNGYVYFNYINTNVGQENPASYSGVSLLFTGSDGWIRKASPSNVSVGYASSAGAVAWSNVDGRPGGATTSAAGLVLMGDLEQNTNQQYLSNTAAPQGHTHGNYLTSSALSGYATESWVGTYYQPKGTYAGTSVATQSANGLMSATDKTNLDGIVASLNNDDSDSVVNRLKDVLSVFQDYPEGTTILSALNSKLNLSGGTMTGVLNVFSTGNNRANINLVSVADVPNDLYFGANNATHWSLTSRDSNSGNFIGLYCVGSPSWVWQTSYTTGVTDFKYRPTYNGTNLALTSEIPTNNNQLTNGAGYITSSGSCAYATTAGSAPASDVYSWAKQSSKPSYTASEVGAAPTSHASSDTTYGIGTSSNYGHVKLKYAWASDYLSGYALGVNQSTSGSTTNLLSGFSDGSSTTRGQAYLKLAVTNEAPPLNISSGVGSLFLQASSNSAEYFANKIVVTDEANLASPEYYTLNLPMKSGTLATLDDIQAGGNYYPIRSYSSGLKISGYSGSSDCELYVPYMTADQYGVAKCAAVRSSSISSSTGYTNGNYYGVEKDSNGKLFVSGPKRYEHNILITKSSKVCVRFRFISSSSTALNTYAKVRSALYNAGYDHSGYGNLLMASGIIYASSTAWNISGIGAASSDSGGIYVFCSRMTNSVADDNQFIYSSDSCSYYDYVRDLISHDSQ